MAVEPARSQSAPTEQELQDADVVAAHAAADQACSEEGPPPRAERRSRLRPREPVDGKPVAPLEGPDGVHGLRPLDAVDRASVQPLLTERDLEPRDLGIEALRAQE